MFDWQPDFLMDLELTWSTGLWGLLLALVTFAVTNLVTIWVVVRLRADYFLDPSPPAFWAERHPGLRWAGLIGKNLLALSLLWSASFCLCRQFQGPGCCVCYSGSYCSIFQENGGWNGSW